MLVILWGFITGETIDEFSGAVFETQRCNMSVMDRCDFLFMERWCSACNDPYDSLR